MEAVEEIMKDSLSAGTQKQVNILLMRLLDTQNVIIFYSMKNLGNSGKIIAPLTISTRWMLQLNIFYCICLSKANKLALAECIVICRP